MNLKNIFNRKKLILETTKEVVLKTYNKKEEVKYFDLAIILSYISGQRYFVNDYYNDLNEFMDMFYFLEDDEVIEDSLEDKAFIDYDYIIKHLLSLYPELENVRYDHKLDIDLETWLKEQKEIYGGYLPVCAYGMQLDEIMSLKRTRS